MKLFVFTFLVVAISSLHLSNHFSKTEPSQACKEILHQKVANYNGRLKLVSQDGKYDETCSESQIDGNSSACTLYANCDNFKHGKMANELKLGKKASSACCPS